MKNNSEIMRSIFNIFSRSGILYFDSPCNPNCPRAYCYYIMFCFIHRCWLPFTNGLIFAFVAPALFITVVSLTDGKTTAANKKIIKDMASKLM